MRKRKSIILFVLLLLILCLFFACDSAKYTITFNSNGGSKVEAIATDGKSDIKMPRYPTKENYIFDGWYYDNNLFRKPFKKDSLSKNPITSNLTVYAKWREKLIASEGLEYELIEDTYTVTGYEGSSKNVVIADNHNGYAVTKIAEEAFKDKKIKSIKISNTITEIGRGAFKGCNSLESMTIPFVGQTREKNYNKEAVFGYIFGFSETFSLFPILTIEQSYNANSSLYFYVPSSLISITITDATKISYGALSNLTNVREITINDDISNIGNNAFYNCKKLECIYLPNSVKYIENQAFYKCDNLTIYCQPASQPSGWKENWKGDNVNTYWDIYRSNLLNEDGMYYLIDEKEEISITSYKQQVEDAVVPSEIHNLPVRSIMSYAFYHLDDIISITIPDSVKQIEIFAISDCGSLTDLILPFVGRSKNDEKKHFGYIFGANNHTNNELFVPSNIKNVTINGGSIAENAFIDCEHLIEICLPSDLEIIGDSAFRNCINLTQINIPQGITQIGEYVFANCTSITSMEIPDSVIEIGKNAFNGCVKLLSIELPQNLTHIREYTFNNCVLLGSIDLPNKLSSIGKRAFSGCKLLEDISLPNSLIRIEDYAFSDCDSFISITIPDSVTSIGDWAFKDCSEIVYIFIPDSVFSMGVQVFIDCGKLTVYCQAPSRPEGYSEQWHGSRPVEWESSPQ